MNYRFFFIFQTLMAWLCETSAANASKLSVATNYYRVFITPFAQSKKLVAGCFSTFATNYVFLRAPYRARYSRRY